jgi:EpsI family protein
MISPVRYRELRHKAMAARSFPSGLSGASLQEVLVIVLFLVLYYGTIMTLVREWSARDDYSHGFLVPFVSLYFVWAGRDRLERISVQPNIPGGILALLLGALLLLLGRAGGVVAVQQVSLLVMIPGIVLFLYGTRYLKELFLPLAYLVLMIPALMEIVFSKAHWPFQLFGAKLAALILSAFDIPVYHNAQYLELPNITLEVADVCSGVRYLLSIIAMAVPLAYIMLRTWRKRVLLVALAILIGILANPVRIALIGIWAYHGGEVVHGPLHIFQGLFVSFAGFAFLFFGAMALSERRGSATEPDRTSDEVSPLGKERSSAAWNMVIVVMLVLAMVLYFYRPLPVGLPVPLRQLPLTIGEWQGRDLDNGSAVSKLFDADHELNRSYTDPLGHELKLYVGYFEVQTQDRKLVRDTLKDLYGRSREVVLQGVRKNSTRINKTVMREGSHDLVAYYWYDLNGRIVADSRHAGIISAFDGLLKRRNNGAAVILSTTVQNGDGPATEKVEERMTAFVQQLLPVLSVLLPNTETCSGPASTSAFIQ